MTNVSVELLSPILAGAAAIVALGNPSKPDLLESAFKITLAIPVQGAAFWERLVREWRSFGYHVVVLSECDEQRYRLRRHSLDSLWIRFRLNVVFPLRVLTFAFAKVRKPAQVILVPTTPFFLPALVAVALQHREVVVIQLLYDLYPDALVLAKKLSVNSFTYRIIRRITKTSLKRCKGTVFLGKRLREHAERLYGSSVNPQIIPVGADSHLFRGLKFAPPCSRITVLYVGNLGYLHDTETLLQLFQRGFPESLHFRFHATGAGYSSLQSEARKMPSSSLERVSFGRALAERDWVQVMGQAEIGLVTMCRGAEDVLFPSKSFSAMMAGQAILAICPADSDLADMVRTENCGWVVEPGDVAGLAGILDEVASFPSVLQEKRQNSLCAGHERFDIGALAERWSQFFSEVTRENRQ